MTDNYTKIVRDNLKHLYSNLPRYLAKNLPGEQDGERFILYAFGEKCIIQPNGITIGKEDYSSVLGILISLYALNSNSEICIPLPFKSFRDFPNSMPYVGAFTTHTEQLLIPHVAKIEKTVQRIIKTLKGEKAPTEAGGDFSFLVYPLPKIALCYIFYKADEEFPASVTCLYSHNANQFLPVDGLADVGEYTSKKIIKIVEQ